MITNTWVIEQMLVAPQKDGESDVVVTASWRCTGTDGTNSAYVYGSCNFTLQQGGSFTPYDQLTQDQVLDWCYSNGVDKTATEENVALQIQAQIQNPIIAPRLPWATPLPADEGAK